MYQMYDRGQVKSLDDPLSTYCPGFSMINTYNSRNITLRQIASQVHVDIQFDNHVTKSYCAI